MFRVEPGMFIHGIFRGSCGFSLDSDSELSSSLLHSKLLSQMESIVFFFCCISMVFPVPAEHLAVLSKHPVSPYERDVFSLCLEVSSDNSIAYNSAYLWAF